MTEFLHQPGFLGTQANMAADITLVAMLAIAALFTTGFAMALRKKYEVHRWIQTTAGVLNIGMVLWMMVLPFRDFILPGIPARLGERFYWITTLHATFGATAVTFGAFVMLRGNRLVPKALRFTNYKLFMRTAYALYMATTLIGIFVYFAWWVWNPNPPLFQ